MPDHKKRQSSDSAGQNGPAEIHRGDPLNDSAEAVEHLAQSKTLQIDLLDENNNGESLAAVGDGLHSVSPGSSPASADDAALLKTEHATQSKTLPINLLDEAVALEIERAVQTKTLPINLLDEVVAAGIEQAVQSKPMPANLIEQPGSTEAEHATQSKTLPISLLDQAEAFGEPLTQQAVPPAAVPQAQDSSAPSVAVLEAQAVKKKPVPQEAPVARTMSEPSSHPNVSGMPSLEKVQELVGRRVGGRYVLEEFLGSGGMSIVYRGTDKRANRPVAIKLMHQQTEVNNKVLERFQQEGKALSQLNHKNIVKVYEYGMHEGSLPFMVMEYVKGPTLSSLLSSVHKLSSQEAVDIILQVCAALDHAHTLRVVHRDLKPSNVMIHQDELGGKTVKLVDFGIAKIAAETKMQLTNTGDIFGSPLYMSPEQCNGWPVDKRTDLYSLGCVLYECLTGSPPFVGETPMATMLMHQYNTPPTLKEGTLGYTFPEKLEQIIARLLQKDRDSRYQSAYEVRSDLQALRESGLTSDEQPPFVPGNNANFDILRSLRGHCADRFGITKEVADAWRITKAPSSVDSLRAVMTPYVVAAFLVFFVPCLLFVLWVGISSLMGPQRSIREPETADRIAAQEGPPFERRATDEGNQIAVQQLLNRMQTAKDKKAHNFRTESGQELTATSDHPGATGRSSDMSGKEVANTIFDKSGGLALDVGDYYLKFANLPKDLGNVEEVRFPRGMTVGVKEFRKLSKSPIRSIDMTGCLIGSGLSELRDNPYLLCLDASDTNIATADVANLNTHIRELKLNDCLADDSMVEELLRLKNLRRLSLARTIVSDRSIPTLLKMNLERLDLRGTRISPEKVKLFLKQKPNCVVTMQ